MIEFVQIGASQNAETSLSGLHGIARDAFVEALDLEIQAFLQEQFFTECSILTLCTSVAALFGENAVASHLVFENILVVYVDSLSADAKSKFIYTQHSDWIQ